MSHISYLISYNFYLITHNSISMEIIEPDSPKRLKRSNIDKMLSGVCGGLAKYLDVDSTIIRLAFAFAAVFAGTGILIYLIMWIIMPKENF